MISLVECDRQIVLTNFALLSKSILWTFNGIRNRNPKNLGNLASGMPVTDNMSHPLASFTVNHKEILTHSHTLVIIQT